MSDQKVLKPSKFALVNSVVAILNLGDYGKVEGFVIKTVKYLERENETISRSIANAKHNLKTKISGLQEELEDAQMAVEEAYTNLDPKDLKTNEAQRTYMAKYLEAIDRAEGYVLGLEEKIKEAEKQSKDEIDELKKQADVRKKRVTRLNTGVVK